MLLLLTEEQPSGAMLYEISCKLMDYEMFLVGYLGYTFEEIANHMHNTSDYKACVLKMLSLWRCKDDKVKTIAELLSALDMVSELPIHVVKRAVKGEQELASRYTCYFTKKNRVLS